MEPTVELTWEGRVTEQKKGILVISGKYRWWEEPDITRIHDRKLTFAQFPTGTQVKISVRYVRKNAPDFVSPEQVSFTGKVSDFLPFGIVLKEHSDTLPPLYFRLADERGLISSNYRLEMDSHPFEVADLIRVNVRKKK